MFRKICSIFCVKTVDKHLFGTYNKNISFEHLFELIREILILQIIWGGKRI